MSTSGFPAGKHIHLDPHRLSLQHHNTQSETGMSLISGFLFHHWIFPANMHSLSLSDALDHVVMQPKKPSPSPGSTEGSLNLQDSEPNKHFCL